MISLLIIYMKKILHFDWLREMQFPGNTMQKRGNSVQKEVTNQVFSLVDDHRKSQVANQMRAPDGAIFA